MTDGEFAATMRSKISDDKTYPCTYYGDVVMPSVTVGTGHISIVAGNGDAVSCTTSVNHQ